MGATPRFHTLDINKTERPKETGAQTEPDYEIRREEDARLAGEVEAEERVETTAPLFAEDVAGPFRKRWDTIQASFVDEPRGAVEQADALVAETMQRLADTFARERSRLEQQFDRSHEEGRDVSTEDLRQTLQHYRSFFTRLLSV